MCGQCEEANQAVVNDLMKARYDDEIDGGNDCSAGVAKTYQQASASIYCTVISS